MVAYTQQQFKRLSEWALLMVILLLPIAICPWSYDIFELPKLLLARILITLILLSSNIMFYRSRSVRNSVLHAPILTVLGVTVASTLQSPLYSVSLLGSYEHYAGLLWTSDCIILYFAAFHLSQSKQFQHYIFIAVITAATITATYGIAQRFGIDRGFWDTREVMGTSALKYRSFSTLASPSFLGLYLAISLPLAASRMVAAQRTLWQVYWGSAIALITLCAVCTYSRAAWVGIIIGLGVQLLGTIKSYYQHRATYPTKILRFQDESSPFKLILVVVTIFTGSIILGNLLVIRGIHPTAIQHAKAVTNMNRGSTAVRIKLWQGALHMIAARPILGWGPETFRYIFARFAPRGMKDTERVNLSAHNVILDCTVQNGLLGLLSYIWLALVAFGVCKRILAATSTFGDHQNSLAVISGLTAYLVAIQFGFSSLAPTSLCWILLGYLSAQDVKPSRIILPRHFQQILIILTGIWCCITIWTLRWFIADIHCRATQRSLVHGDTAMAAFEINRAVQLQPVLDFYAVRQGQIQDMRGLNPEISYRSAVLANPLNAANHALLAQCLEMTGHWPEALEEWNKTSIMDPQWSQPQNAIGLIYHRMRNETLAIRYYKNAIEEDPNYAIAYNNLGNAYLAKGLVNDAISSYQRALKLKPEWKVAQSNLRIAIQSIQTDH